MIYLISLSKLYIQVKPVCLEVLMVIAERMTLNYTSLQVLKASFDQKSPKVRHNIVCT